MAAAIDPQRERERENEQNQWLRLVEETGIGLSRDRRRSPPGPSGPGRNESPRKVGRSRTDTMVYSEAYTVVEELAKADASEAELERAIDAERKAEPADTNVSEPSGEHALPETPATNTPESLVTEIREPSPPLSEPPALGVDMNPPDSAPVSAVDDTATSVDEPPPPPLPSIDVLPPSNMVEIPEAPALELSVDEATPSASLTERSHSPQKDSEATIEATIEADTDASPEVKEVSPTVEGEEQMQTEEVQITEARSSTESATDEPQAESVSDTLESLAQQEPPVVPSSEEPLVPYLPDQHPPEKVTPRLNQITKL
ncbi:hypothetical protein A0H81_02411 [Grifola frondosa]|uniref:Uncharacterized protein n=1 Tax=Grifola frondosa TaxID=5627 RepID=A0A1C7MKS8_GRIFR|nr:hypothetical protein A0H81_02411 [Grifola frondosa]